MYIFIVCTAGPFFYEWIQIHPHFGDDIEITPAIIVTVSLLPVL